MDFIEGSNEILLKKMIFKDKKFLSLKKAIFKTKKNKKLITILRLISVKSFD